MTVRDLLERVPVSPLIRTAIRSTLAMVAPGSLDASIGLKIDRAAERVRLDLDGRPALECSFDEAESYVASTPSR